MGINDGIRIIGSAVGTRQDIWEAIEFVQRGVVKLVVEMATLDDLSNIADNFGKVRTSISGHGWLELMCLQTSGKYVLRLAQDESA
jgi:D-arabinose 1-dehydrogenase-like Zn-dependent alcohol dehydrogenase